MNEYILYTTEGSTLAPNQNVDVDNCQILGFVKAENSSEAKDLLIENNPWVVEAGFSENNIVVRQILTMEWELDSVDERWVTCLGLQSGIPSTFDKALYKKFWFFIKNPPR